MNTIGMTKQQKESLLNPEQGTKKLEFPLKLIGFDNIYGFFFRPTPKSVQISRIFYENGRNCNDLNCGSDFK
jgi:hypothetical protein